MSNDPLLAIYSRGAQAGTFDTAVSIGGVDATSASNTYDVAHFSGGALLVNVGGAALAVSGGGPVSQSGSWTVSVRDSSGNPALATNATPVGTEQAWIARAYNYGQGRTTDPAAVANAATAPMITDSLGKQVVLPGSVNDLHLDGQAAVAGVLATALIANQGAGRRIALQSILTTCSGSQTVLVIVSGGPNNRTFGYAFPGGGFALNAGGAPLYITSASTALSVAGDVTATFNVFASGYSLSN